MKQLGGNKQSTYIHPVKQEEGTGAVTHRSTRSDQVVATSPSLGVSAAYSVNSCDWIRSSKTKGAHTKFRGNDFYAPIVPRGPKQAPSFQLLKEDALSSQSLPNLLHPLQHYTKHLYQLTGHLIHQSELIQAQNLQHGFRNGNSACELQQVKRNHCLCRYTLHISRGLLTRDRLVRRHLRLPHHTTMLRPRNGTLLSSTPSSEPLSQKQLHRQATSLLNRRTSMWSIVQSSSTPPQHHQALPIPR